MAPPPMHRTICHGTPLPSSEPHPCCLPAQEAAAWMRCLVQAATMLDRQTLLAQVVPLALERGQVNESASGRMTACAMLTCVAPHLVRPDPQTAVGVCHLS